MTENCPQCHGDGTVYAGKEWKMGLAGSYEVNSYKECTKCSGTGEIESTAFETDHVKRIMRLETELSEIKKLLEHHNLR